jgi:hypothetical protein
MNWDCQIVIAGSSAVILPCDFTAQLLAIEVRSQVRKDTWFKSGYLHTFVNLDGLSFTGRQFTLGFDRQLIEIPYSSYQLSFQPVEWSVNTTISIKQILTTQYREIIMSASYDPGIRTVGADSASTVNASVANVVLAATNLNRAPEGFIVNNSNKNLWVTFTGTAATAAAPATKVLPSGGNIDIPGNYTGVINGIWEASATGSCVVHEFSYI